MAYIRPQSLWKWFYMRNRPRWSSPNHLLLFFSFWFVSQRCWSSKSWQWWGGYRRVTIFGRLYQLKRTWLSSRLVLVSTFRGGLPRVLDLTSSSIKNVLSGLTNSLNFFKSCNFLVSSYSLNRWVNNSNSGLQSNSIPMLLGAQIDNKSSLHHEDVHNWVELAVLQ